MSTSAQETPTTPEPVAAPAPADVPQATAPAPPVLACAHCGAALRPDQEWCLECGQATRRTRIAGARGWRLPMLLAALVALLAGAGAAIWLVSLSDDAATKASSLTTAAALPVAAAPVPSTPTASSPAAGRTTTVTKTRTKTVTTAGRVVTAPARTVTAPGRTVTVTTPAATTPSAASVAGWPAATTAYTVVVLSGGRATAYAKAQKLEAAGTSAGVLDTKRFSASGTSARYVVFAGRFATRAAASRFLAKLTASEPNAYVGFVKPR